MKIVCVSDIHGTSRPSRGRLGDPLVDYSAKMQAIFELSADNNNAPIISAGDCFNGPRDIVALFAFLQIRSKFKDTEFYTVWGQHDMYFRSNVVITNLAILENAGAIKILGEKPVMLNGKPKHLDSVGLYGLSWSDKPANAPQPNRKNDFNILAVHAPISKRPIAPGVSTTNPDVWARKNKGYDLIICGDIHKPFIKHTDNGIVINTGPVMRLTTDKHIMRHKPHVILFDTEKSTYEKVYLPYRHHADVLDPGFKPDLSDIDTAGEFDITAGKVKEIRIFDIIDDLLTKSGNAAGIRKALASVSKDWR